MLFKLGKTCGNKPLNFAIKNGDFVYQEHKTMNLKVY